LTPVFDWTGFYLGAHVGYGDPSFGGKFDSDEEDNEDISFADKIDADGILAGFQAGYNWQMDSLVLGIETDFSITDFSGDTEDQTHIAQGAGWSRGRQSAFLRDRRRCLRRKQVRLHR